MLLGLPLLQAINSVYGLGVFVVDAHLVRRVFYRHVLIEQVYELEALLVGNFCIRSLERSLTARYSV